MAFFFNVRRTFLLSLLAWVALRACMFGPNSPSCLIICYVRDPALNLCVITLRVSQNI